MSSPCPFTGLDVIRRPEWTDVDLGDGYRATYSIIGQSILVSKPQGYGTRRAIEFGAAFTDRLLGEFIPKSRPYVWIEDLSGVRSTSIEARKFYIDFMKKKTRMRGLVFCGPSALMKFSVEVAKTLHLVNFEIVLVADYGEAVKTAVDLLSGQTSRRPGNRQVPPVSGTDSPQAESCPVSGLPMTTRPEWSGIDLGSGNTVSFKKIGDGVLWVKPRGNFDRASLHALVWALNDVSESMGETGQSLVQLVDLSRFNVADLKTAANLLRMGVTTGTPKIAAVIYYQAPLMIRVAHLLGRVINPSSIPVFKARDYDQAVFSALKWLEKRGPVEDVFTRKENSQDWFRKFEGFSFRFEIIGPDVLHGIAMGIPEESHIASCADLQAEVIESEHLVRNGPYFYILNVQNISIVNSRERKYFVNTLLQLHRDFPLRMLVVYGVDRIQKAGVNIARPFAPFKMRVADSLDGALEMIAEDKSGQAGSSKSSGSDDSLPAQSARDLIQQYADELLEFIGGIRWERLHDTSRPEVDPDHPFATVFDAWALVKSDLDDLFVERQRAEKARLESERKYRELIENLNDVVFRIDHRNILVYVSPSVERQTGFKPEELIGHPFSDFVHPDDLPRIGTELDRQSPDNWERIEFRIYKSDGAEIWVSASIRQIIENGSVVGLNGILNDITERKRAEEALKDSEEKARVLLNAPEESAILIDRDGLILDINELGARAQGKTVEELVGSRVEDLHPSELAGLMAKTAMDIFREGTQVRFETDFGEEFREIHMFPIFDSLGEVIQIASFTREVTAQKLAQIEILRARDMAEKASRTKTEFLANISHELKTPLNPILGMTDIVLAMEQDPEKIELLGFVRDGAGRLLNLIEDLIELSRIEAEGLKIRHHPIALAMSLSCVVEQCSSRAAEKKLAVNWWIEPGIPEIVSGDAALFYKVLRTVVDNAVKFTHEGEIRIEVTRERDQDPRERLRFSVSDTGVGIPGDHLKCIFQDFTQADGSSTRAFGGLGLGLTLARRLVELMDGRIWAESVRGQGSTFHIVLPFEPYDSECNP